jgi:hypothetical protein
MASHINNIFSRLGAPAATVSAPTLSKPLNTAIKTNNSTLTSLKGSSTWGRIIAYVLAIIVVIAILLLFIHYFITPVFKMHPGDPGYIPLPGYDDGVLQWTKGSPFIANKNTIISSSSYNYSLIMDIFIQNPLQFSAVDRILFTRGALLNEKPQGETLTGMMSNYNLVVALTPDTNDLIVSVLNVNNNMENVLVPNVPVQEPFRLGIIFMEQALEVYMNGKLVHTRVFSASPKAVMGDIMGPLGQNATVALIRNLKMWNRVLTSSEIRYSPPAMMTAAGFGAQGMPSSSSCPSFSSSSSSSNAENRLEKLTPF